LPCKSRFTLAEAAEAEVHVEAEVVEAAPHAREEVSRRRWVLDLLRARRHDRVLVARGRGVDKSLDPGRALARGLAVDRRLAPGLAALRAQAHGPAGRAVESDKAARDLVAACQARVLEPDPEWADQAAISRAVVPRRANSITSSILDPPRGRLEPAAGSGRAQTDVRGLPRGQAARDVPAGPQPTSCKTARHHSCQLVAQRSGAQLSAPGWELRRSFRRAVRIGPTSAVDKLATGKLVPAIDPPPPLQALAAPARTLAVPELLTWADRALPT
jgi:hypothetical protein